MYRLAASFLGGRAPIERISSLFNQRIGEALSGIYSKGRESQFTILPPHALSDGAVGTEFTVKINAENAFSPILAEIYLRRFLLSHAEITDFKEVAQKGGLRFYRLEQEMKDIAQKLFRRISILEGIPPGVISFSEGEWMAGFILTQFHQDCSKYSQFAKDNFRGSFLNIKSEDGRLVIKLNAGGSRLDMKLIGKICEDLLGSSSVTYGGYPDTEDSNVYVSASPDSILERLTPLSSSMTHGK